MHVGFTLYAINTILGHYGHFGTSWQESFRAHKKRRRLVLTGSQNIRLHLSMEQRTSQNIKFSILSYEAQKSVQKSGAQWRTLYVLDHLAFG